MKFIIAQGRKKRVLDKPFNICASREDFKLLQKKIEDWLVSESTYGWLRVDDYPFWTTDHDATKGEPDSWES